MHELLNVLYIQLQGTVLHLDHDTVRVEHERETKLRVPLLRLSGIVAFGQVTITPFLIQRCAEDGRSLVWLGRNGRFKARVEGQTRGNVLLRRAQHLALSDEERTTSIARQIVAGKIQNSRQTLLRAARETEAGEDRSALSAAGERLAGILKRLPACPTVDTVRGAEGEAARSYFGVFGCMVRNDREAFGPAGRTKRPPRDRANAVLSFLYALVRAECTTALVLQRRIRQRRQPPVRASVGGAVCDGSVWRARCASGCRASSGIAPPGCTRAGARAPAARG